MSGRRYVFNLYPTPDTQQTPGVTYLYGNDAVIELIEPHGEASVHLRHRAQAHSPQQTLPDAHPMFGSALDWAYREYIIRRLWDADGQGNPLGNSPGMPVDPAAREQQLREAHSRLERSRSQQVSPRDERLYLFNVIVAPEWRPGEEYMERLEWALRRASDLLFDVTNGRMAFGQVVFAGSSWMDHADIQIMASNRLLPRSWVSGLLDAAKYTPIRVGRGVWTRRAQVPILWDEPDAYRTLVHEWAHYALNQRDAYLTRLPGQVALGDAYRGYDIVVPTQRASSESVMATPEGNSELDNPLRIEGASRYYPNLDMPPGKFAGPGRLPLPLPVFRRTEGLRDEPPRELVLAIPSHIRNERCSVYVLQAGGNGDTERIIAQGTCDARSRQDGFLLLGGGIGDTVVLIDEFMDPGGEPRIEVWSGVIERQDAQPVGYSRRSEASHSEAAGTESVEVPRTERSAGVVTWTNATPDPASLPLIYVEPGQVPGAGSKSSSDSAPEAWTAQAADGRYAGIKAHVDPVGGTVSIFPNGRASHVPETEALQHDAFLHVEALDGQLKVDLDDGTFVIGAFSQGGSPATAPVVGTNPITAGSADGEALLFFDSSQIPEGGTGEYSKHKVVTTTLHNGWRGPSGATACSKVFAIAGNQALPATLYPTLVILSDPATGGPAGPLHIYRLKRDDRTWVRLPTYVEPGGSFAACPLAAVADDGRVAGGSLLGEPAPGDGAMVEYFALYREPGGTQPGVQRVQAGV